MSLEALLPYFERELEQLRAPVADFARRHPHAARRLGLQEGSSPDPRVERLMEAFAFLTARIQKRLDEDHREISSAFLQVLHPLATQPIPSATVLAFKAAPEAFSQGAVRIPRLQTVVGPDQGGRRCTFRTTRDLELWPLQVQKVQLSVPGDLPAGSRDSRVQARLQLDLETIGGFDFANLDLNHLDVFLDGDPPRTEPLLEALLSRVVAWQACLQDGDREGPIVHGSQGALSLLGLDPGEAMLDPGPLGLQAHRLLLEWFAFPEQFTSLRISGLNHPDLRRPFRRMRLTFDLGGLPDAPGLVRHLQALPAGMFRLGCTPALNLFPALAEPIRLTHRSVSYPIRVDPRRPGVFHVHHVQRVRLGSPGSREAIEVPPFFGFTQGGPCAPCPFRWHTARSLQGNLKLVLVDLDFQPLRPDHEVLSLEVACSQGDLPASFPAAPDATFHLPGCPGAPLGLAIRPPTPGRPAPADQGEPWRLVSHLALATAPLLAAGVPGLKEWLHLHDVARTPQSSRQIQALSGFEAQSALTRLDHGALNLLVQGLDLHLTFDEALFGPGLYRFGCILDEVLARTSSFNTFTRLHLHARQRQTEMGPWPARSGTHPLI